TQTIITLKNGIEAQIMKDLLDEKGIPHIIKTFHDSVYDGIFQTETAWGEIESLPEFADEITELYKEVTESGNDKF
ncbi:MAG: hypothetical protein JXR31_13665, partial [Prolixibacteraceae bacterium]|nr:hypothetical protein [Prolixibacteraceae bacterium]